MMWWTLLGIYLVGAFTFAVACSIIQKVTHWDIPKDDETKYLTIGIWPVFLFIYLLYSLIGLGEMIGYWIGEKFESGKRKES